MPHPSPTARYAGIFFALTSAVAAQTVVPASCIATEGDRQTNVFGQDNVRVVQHIGPALLPAPMVIQAVDFRRDNDWPSTYRYDFPHGLNDHAIEIAIGDYDESYRLTRAFATPNRKIVFASAKHRLPDLTPHWDVGQRWVELVKLDGPYIYLGKGLALDVTITHLRDMWIVYPIDAQGGRVVGISDYGKGRDLKSRVGTDQLAVVFDCALRPQELAVLAIGFPMSHPSGFGVAPVWVGAAVAWSSGLAQIRIPFVPYLRDVAAQWVAPIRTTWPSGGLSNRIIFGTDDPQDFYVSGDPKQSTGSGGGPCLVLRFR